MFKGVLPKVLPKVTLELEGDEALYGLGSEDGAQMASLVASDGIEERPLSIDEGKDGLDDN